MTHDLRLLNRQRIRKVDLPLLRRVILDLLAQFSPSQDADLSVTLVGAREMARLNSTHLGHAGSTDVITLDYSDSPDGSITGELFICVDEAMAQAAQFNTIWQSEMMRYIVHGLLHLLGFDDLEAATRRRMKREENRLLKDLERRFDLRKLGRAPKVGA